MEKMTTIQEELTTISPLLAALPKVNVYTVPDFYFEDFTTSLITLVSTTGYMDDVAKHNPSMQVPEAYFDQLATSILHKINTQQPLSLSDDGDELHHHLKNLRSNNVYKTPANYFDNFSSKILAKINVVEDDVTEETNSISPLLGRIGKTNVLEVPAGYFDQLSNSILKNTKPVTKVIRLQTRNVFLRYAVAAMLIVAFCIIAIKFSNKPTENNGTYAAVESSISKGIKMDDKKFDETLNNLSEDDIAAYLQKNGTEADLALLTNAIDNGAVPSEDDYLSDEKTLEKFLKEIDTKKLNN
jgi:hypothetical protein